MATAWFHRTCEHGHARITEAGGLLYPTSQVMLGDLPMLWLALTPTATAAQLGLDGRVLLSCDRMQYLYRVDDADAADVMPWQLARDRPELAPYRPMIEILEAKRGTRPALWGIAARPVHATLVV